MGGSLRRDCPDCAGSVAVGRAGNDHVDRGSIRRDLLARGRHFQNRHYFSGPFRLGLEAGGGIFGILAGIIVLQHPLWSPLLLGSALIVVLGIQGMIVGVVGLVQAFKGAGWGSAILGLVSILFGLIFLANVLAFTISLPWVIGILALIGGGLAIVAAFRMK